MSDHQAQQEAQRRLGGDGAAWHHPQARPGDLRYCCVGLRVGDCLNNWLILGKGTCWKEAFADAARKKKR